MEPMTDTLATDSLTISDAARMAGVDRRIIRRHLQAGRFPRAQRAPGVSGAGNGPWQIPKADLHDAGLLASDPREAAATETEPAPSRTGGLEIIRLHTLLDAALRRAETAEATVLECERVIEAQRLALAEGKVAKDRHGLKLTGHNSRRLPGASVPTPAAVSELTAPTTSEGGETLSETDDTSTSSVDGEEAGQTVVVSEMEESDEFEAMDRPRLAPRFAGSWAAAPPWEATPVAEQPAPRRWWQRVS